MELQELKPDLSIVKDVSILFDGKQYMIKIPKEVSEFYNLKKGKKMRLKVTPIAEGEGNNTFEVIDE
jgi:hypothetical protein